MQVFELHFNPGKREDIIFDTFCYKPEDIYEKRLGYLFMAGEISNSLPQNERFLKNLSRVLKTKFYSLKTKPSQTCLRESLKEANLFLEKIAKEGDVSWISNLNFAILNLSPKPQVNTKKAKSRKYIFNFTRVGEIEIFLARGQKVLNIGKNLEFDEVDPYPLKIFSNVVSGELEWGDRILILSKGISEAFSSQKIVTKIAKLPYIDQRAINQVLKEVEKGIFGICLILCLEPSRSQKSLHRLVLKEKLFKKRIQAIFEKSLAGAFFLKKTAERLLNLGKIFFKRAWQILLKIKEKVKIREVLAKIRIPRIKIPSTFPKIHFPFHLPHIPLHIPIFKEKTEKKVETKVITSKIEEKIEKVEVRVEKKPEKIEKPKEIEGKVLSQKFSEFLNGFLQKINKIMNFCKEFFAILFKKRNLILISSLVLILAIGNIFTKIEENRKAAKLRPQLEQIQGKVDKAISLLSLEKTSQANDLLLEAFQQIEALGKVEGSIKKEILQVEEQIKVELSNLNKLETIENPELVFDFAKEKFVPNKMVILSEKMYFFNTGSENLIELTKDGKTRIIEVKAKFNDAASGQESIFFFSKPNRLFALKNNAFEQETLLESPYKDFEFENLSFFKSNLYFLDKKTGQIVKYEPVEENFGNPEIWLKEGVKRAILAKEIAVDGDVWILNNDNSVDKYFGGEFKESLSISTFPLVVNFTKIWTRYNLSYFYILEPEQKRIMILDKEGQVMKQYQSEKFDNLKDFAVSEDGKIIYILNDLKLYQINLE